MAENKEYMIHQEEDGAIQISEDVVASIASTTASEVDGVSAMMSANVSDLMGGKKMSAKGVRVEPVHRGALRQRHRRRGQEGAADGAYRTGRYDRLPGGGGQCPRGRHQLQLNQTN